MCLWVEWARNYVGPYPKWPICIDTRILCTEVSKNNKNRRIRIPAVSVSDTYRIWDTLGERSIGAS